MDTATLAYVITLGTTLLGLIGVVINVLCCSDDYNDEDRRENELTRYDTGLPAEKEPTLAIFGSTGSIGRSSTYNKKSTVGQSDVLHDVEFETNMSLGEKVILGGIVIQTAVFHLNDLATDMAALVTYIEKNSLVSVLISVFAMLAYRILSAHFFWKKGFGLMFAWTQLWDCEIYRQVWYSVKEFRYTKSLVYIKRFEAVYESTPQALVALSFILTEENFSWVLYLSLANSIISIAGTLSWADDTSFPPGYYNGLWFRRYFLRVFEVTARVFTLGYIAVVAQKAFGIVIILVFEFLVFLIMHKCDGSHLFFKSFENVLMFLIAVPNFEKVNKTFVGMYIVRFIECIIILVVSGTLEGSENETAVGIRPEDRAWLVTIAGISLILEMILMWSIKDEVTSEKVGDGIFKAATDGDLDRILDAIQFGGSEKMFDKDKSGWMCIHLAASAGRVKCLHAIAEAMVDEVDKADWRENIDSENIEGYTAMYYAVKSGHEGCVRVLLRFHADPSQEIKDMGGMQLIHLAAENGHGRVCQILIRSTKSVDEIVVGTTGWTPLMYACKNAEDHQTDLVLDVTSCGIDKNTEGDLAEPLPTTICVNDFTQVSSFSTKRIKELHERGEHLDKAHNAVFQEKATAIWTKVIVIPSEDQDEEKVKSISFKAGEQEESIFLHAIQKHIGETKEIHCYNVLFEYLIDRRYNHCIKQLLDMGADINFEKDGITPMSMAARTGDSKLYEIMFEKGAKITQDDLNKARLTETQKDDIKEILNKYLIEHPENCENVEFDRIKIIGGGHTGIAIENNNSGVHMSSPVTGVHMSGVHMSSAVTGVHMSNAVSGPYSNTAPTGAPMSNFSNSPAPAPTTNYSAANPSSQSYSNNNSPAPQPQPNVYANSQHYGQSSPQPYGQQQPYGQPSQPNTYGQPSQLNTYGQPSQPNTYGQPVNYANSQPYANPNGRQFNPDQNNNYNM